MKETMKRTVAGASLALISTVGLTACSNPFNKPDPNKLTVCDNSWVVESIGTSAEVTNMSQAMAQMEMGHSELVAKIHQELGYDSNEIKVYNIPAQYSAAASLLIGKTNEYWYDTNKRTLDTPRDEFCQEDVTFGIYETPAYVNAEAALKAAGIDIDPQDNHS